MERGQVTGNGSSRKARCAGAPASCRLVRVVSAASHARSAPGTAGCQPAFARCKRGWKRILQAVIVSVLAFSSTAMAAEDGDFTNGSRFAEEGKIPEARACMEKVIMKKVTDAASMARRAEAYRVLTEYGRALTDSADAIRQNPNLAEAHMTHGACMFIAGDYKTALNDLDKAIRLNKKLANAFHFQGACYRRQNDHKKATESFSKALEINPRHVEALCGRTASRISLGDLKNAKTDIEKAISVNPNSPTTLVAGASVIVAGSADKPIKRDSVTIMFVPVADKTNSKELKQALENCNKAIAGNKQFATAYSVRALVYHKLGQSEFALKDFATAVTLDPKSAPTLNNQGITLETLGRHEEAIKSFNRAISLFPTYYQALVNKSAVRTVCGDYDRAVRDASLAIRLTPNCIEAYNNRAHAYRLKGDQSRFNEDIKRVPISSSTDKKSTTLYMVSDP